MQGGSGIAEITV